MRDSDAELTEEASGSSVGPLRGSRGWDFGSESEAKCMLATTDPANVSGTTEREREIFRVV